MNHKEQIAFLRKIYIQSTLVTGVIVFIVMACFTFWAELLSMLCSVWEFIVGPVFDQVVRVIEFSGKMHYSVYVVTSLVYTWISLVWYRLVGVKDVDVLAYRTWKWMIAIGIVNGALLVSAAFQNEFRGGLFIILFTYVWIKVSLVDFPWSTRRWNQRQQDESL
jgi:hypothetical protein